MLKPYVFRKAVTTAATQERLTTANIMCSYVRIQAESTNTGLMFIGDSQVSATLGIELKVCAGGDADDRTVESMELHAIGNDLISLRDIWVDAATTADEVQVFCMRKA